MKIEIENIGHLKQVLNDYDINPNDWGNGETRTLQELYKEIVDGETELFEMDGELIRTVTVVGVVVTCGKHRLKEDRQEFTDGRVRHRDLTVSCAEKLINGETPKQAAVRCLKEELGIEVHESELIPHVNHSNTDLSSSYPGLKCVYHRNPFDYEMKPEYFKPEGYQEFQENKTTYFIWK
jgi:hypothetical protein